MTQDSKSVPPAELSMKYMAWNVKQMDANIKRIADSLDQLIDVVKKVSESSNVFKSGDVPF